MAVLPAGERLRGMLAAALAGEGPALAPVDPGLPRERLRRLAQVIAPAAVVTPDGVTAWSGGRRAAGATALVVVTSGSTGEPKAAELSGAALAASARAALARIGARPGERWLCCLPPGHIAGLQVLIRSLIAGTAPLICAPSDTAAIAAAAAGARCAHASLVPTQLRRLLGGGGGLSGLRTILLGGAAAPADLLARARAAGARVVTTYGMTETCGGRADDVITTGGEKVVPAEVAAVVEAHPAVREAVVFGTADRDWGQRVTVVVVPADPARPPAAAGVRAHVRARLPAFAAPREVVIAADIPLLPSGKPDIAALRAWVREQSGGHSVST